MPQLLVDEYLNITEESREKYGPKTIVWMQTGSFYEVYAWKETDEQIRVSRDILQIRVTKKGTDSGGNPAWMAGFPDHSYKRFEKKLLSEKYTIVYVDQISRDPIKRGIVRISSPGCIFDSDNDDSDSILASILLESDGNDWYYHLSVYDSNRGDIQIISVNQPPGVSFEQITEDVNDVVESHRVNELLMNVISDDTIDLSKCLSSILVHKRVISPNIARKEILDVKTFQKDALNQYFSKYRTLYENIIDTLDLGSVLPGDIGNLILMLDFLKEHEPIFVQNLPRPRWVNVNSEKTHMETYNHAFKKLQVFSKEGDDLMKFVNKTLTIAGKKKLISLVRTPSCRPHVLEERYDSVELFMNNRTLLSSIKTHLHIRDLERLYRRFAIGRIDPYGDIPRVCDMNCRIVTLLSSVCELSNHPHWVPSKEVLDNFIFYVSEIDEVFSLDACKSGKGNVFNDGVAPELEKKFRDLDLCFTKLESTRSMLSDLIVETIYLRNTEKDGYYYETTKKRATKLSKLLEKKNPEKLRISTTTAHAKITSENTIKLSEEIIYLKHQIDRLTHKLVQEKVSRWYETFYDNCIAHVIEAMAWMDVYYSYATVAIEWNYVRPTLIESENSCIDAKELRHPIIEQLLSNERKAFIPNDVVIGSESNYLLYGVNSVGKSSLLKSVALSTLMAQSGMFVPAKKYTFCPYERLIVRIGNTDNLFEAHSSFICEIREASQCVNYANNRTLVIADEFCASTERDSATQIVTSMLQWLDRNNSSYLFATHLFELLETTQNIKNLNVVHLKIRVDNEGWIFDRKITPGPPKERNYGAMIASKIFKEPLFVKMLKRNQVKVKQKRESRRSRYNSSLIISSCAVCGYVPDNEMSLPLDTHHINMQCMANSDGFIENYHKNNLYNLVVLCKVCHVKVHSGHLNISGWEQRDSGTVLNFNEESSIV